MASASCNMTVTELEMKLIVPHRKFVPMFSSAAAEGHEEDRDLGVGAGGQRQHDDDDDGAMMTMTTISDCRSAEES